MGRPIRLLDNAFSGLNNRLAPHLLPAGTAADVSNIVATTGQIAPRNGVGVSVQAAAGAIASLYKFNGVWLASTTDWQYVEWGGRLYRATSGQTPQKSANGTTFYNLAISAPGSAPTVAAGAAGLPNGTYSCYVTFVGTLGDESPPSPVGSVTVALQQISWSGIPTSADAQVVSRRLYRSGGSISAGPALIATIADNVTTTYADNVADTAVGAQLTTTLHAAPGQLEGLAVNQQGVFFGWIGSTLYYSEPAIPGAWPVLNTLTLAEAIKGLLAFETGLLIVTTAGSYFLSGASSSAFFLSGRSTLYGLVARDTLVDGGGVAWWLSPRGVVQYAGGVGILISESSLSDAFMATIVASTIRRGARFGTSYLLFHDAGFLELDPRIGPNGWNKGVLPTSQARVAHYERTEGKLYVVQDSAIRQWEGGAALTCSLTTRDWTDPSLSARLFPRRLMVYHSGTVTVTFYLDGVQLGEAKSRTRSSMGRSDISLPFGAGGRASVKVEGTGTVREVLLQAGVSGAPWAT